MVSEKSDFTPVSSVAADKPERAKFWNLSLNELRDLATGTSSKEQTPATRKRTVYERSEAVRVYVLMRANGKCEANDSSTLERGPPRRTSTISRGHLQHHFRAGLGAPRSTAGSDFPERKNSGSAREKSPVKLCGLAVLPRSGTYKASTVSLIFGPAIIQDRGVNSNFVVMRFARYPSFC
jgi:hypothetical protein